MIYWPARPLSRTTTTKLTPSHSHPAVSDLLVRRNILNHFLVGLSVNKNMTFQKISDSADDNPAPQQRVGPPINAGSALSDIHSHQPPCPRHHPTGLHYPTRQSASKRSVVPNHARLPPCERLSARCHARQHYKAYENQKIQDEYIVMKLDMQRTYLAKQIFPHSTEQCADKWVHQSRQPMRIG